MTSSGRKRGWGRSRVQWLWPYVEKEKGAEMRVDMIVMKNRVVEVFEPAGRTQRNHSPV